MRTEDASVPNNEVEKNYTGVTCSTMDTSNHNVGHNIIYSLSLSKTVQYSNTNSNENQIKHLTYQQSTDERVAVRSLFKIA